MAPSFRTAPWALIAVVILALWAWSTYVASPPALPGATPSGTSTDRSPLPDTATSTASAANAVGRSAVPDQTRRNDPAAPVSDPAWLPPEARETLRLIARGGPFPYPQDGGIFGNRERQLPPQPRGWYREYTVDTPGSRDRGARRIITGGDPPVELYFTDDHYRSFRRIPDAGGAQ